MLFILPVSTNIAVADFSLPLVEITELLPRPKLPQTDKNNEFIELYNQGSKPFELGGYSLRIGSSVRHYYVFPKGTQLKPGTYTAFYSAKTHLLLDNYSDQVSLLNPQDKIVSQSPLYKNARIGESWSKGLKLWYWAAKPTPGAPNTGNFLP